MMGFTEPALLSADIFQMSLAMIFMDKEVGGLDFLVFAIDVVLLSAAPNRPPRPRRHVVH